MKNTHDITVVPSPVLPPPVSLLIFDSLALEGSRTSFKQATKGPGSASVGDRREIKSQKSWNQ